MNPYANFISALEDRDRCAAGFDQYELMRIPSMPRFLLLEGLIDHVNSEFRLRIRFRVGGVLEPRRDAEGKVLRSQLLIGSTAESFDPDHLRGIPSHEGFKPPTLREVTRRPDMRVPANQQACAYNVLP